LAEIRADGGAVPPLRQVTLGGEAVPSALLTQLKARFPDARISQIYGATEMGQNVTVRDGKPGLPLSVLDEGGDVVFKIVDGELWVRSRSSMLGYFDQPQIPSDGWRATGDLVEVVDDRIRFRGRSSEVINVGGVKVHPLPIEDRVSQVKGVALVRAFGRASAMVGNIVALEIVPVPGVDMDELGNQIRAACADLPPAARPRSIKFVPTMETAGNKMTRKRRP
jgi:acyl-CoA synthetase (AMP-forming)/AMP-acid ligase II